MTDIRGTGRPTVPSGEAAAHEEYSFVCLRCGHGWEQAYDIEHHTDAQGETTVVWVTEGRQVPSPLSSPNCDHCGGHQLRIMRPGRVASVRESVRQASRPAPVAWGTPSTGGSVADVGAPGLLASEREGTRQPSRHLWHVSNLVRLLHLRSRPRA